MTTAGHIAFAGFDIGLDLFPLLAAALAGTGCALLGNFLVLRRLSLMGDAISHSVLPGLVVAFLIASTRDPLAMLLGAAASGAVTVLLVELVKKLGRVEPGAAMGVVFSILFALGVLLIERAAVRHVDLDADCVLHGQLETLAWYGAPDTLAGLLSWETLDAVPRQVVVLAAMAVGALVFTALLFKELRLSAFDPALASALGFNAHALHLLLMIFVAFATVASFEAVGSILVIAMLICPAATARLLTDRLLPQVVWSVAIGLAGAVAGYIAATAVPAAFGRDAVNAAGSMTVVSGGLLALALVAAPRHGLITRAIRRRRLADSIAADDVIAALFREREAGRGAVPRVELRRRLIGRRVDRALRVSLRTGRIREEAGSLSLTEEGVRAAADVVRKHRLWERYLVDRAGIPADHVHETAELLEHTGTAPPAGPSRDPHGRTIPPA